MIRSDYTVRNNYAAHPHNSAFFLLPGKGGELVLDQCRIKVQDQKVPFFSSTGHRPMPVSLMLNNTTVEPAGSVVTNLFKQVTGEFK